jgi:hypothetical protein
VRQTDKREAILLVLQAVVPRPEERLLCYLLECYLLKLWWRALKNAFSAIFWCTLWRLRRRA